MTNIQVKKVSKYILWTYLVVVCLFTIGAYDKLFMKTESGVSRLVFYLPFVALAGGLLFFYTRLLQKNGEKGRRVIGAGFFETIHKYRFLIEQLVTRDFKIKYKRSVLGVFWSFLNPLLMMIVQYIVFSHLLNIRGGVAHYAIYLLCGIVMWNGFNDCSMQSMRSITGNSALITKVYVPKYIYPVTKVFSASGMTGAEMAERVLNAQAFPETVRVPASLRAFVPAGVLHRHGVPFVEPDGVLP